MYSRYADGFFNCTTHGFLPTKSPLQTLPGRYQRLQTILDRMSIRQPDGSPGYLAIPDRIAEVVSDDQLCPYDLPLVKFETEIPVIQALYRAYAFLSSAYLLETSYQTFQKTGQYGQARQELPAKLARPLCYLAEKLEVFPWIEYSYCYSLGNYTLRDERNSSLDWRNLKMAVSFSGTENENGFIMVHVDINQFSPDLVRGVLDLVAPSNLVGGAALTTHWQPLPFLRSVFTNLSHMNNRRKEMWTASDHHHYNDFRIFIMGIQGNTAVFGNGVRYLGTEDESPRQYRGQSGSQDTIIPLMDTCFRVIDYYPQNELTDYLYDMRRYRPQVFQRLLTDVEKWSVGLLDRVAKSGVESLIYYLAILNEIYTFRNGHWQFVQKYIMKNTNYGIATGGTPVISWIPNQIEATLMAVKDCLLKISIGLEQDDNVDLELFALYESIKKQYPNKVTLLQNQLTELKKVNYSVDLIYDQNLQLGEVDIGKE